MVDASAVRASHAPRRLTPAQWEKYRDDILTYMERTGDSVWWETTGRHLVAMADGRLAALVK